MYSNNELYYLFLVKEIGHYYMGYTKSNNISYDLSDDLSDDYKYNIKDLNTVDTLHPGRVVSINEYLYHKEYLIVINRN